jgi:hypothetical protein
MNIKSKMFHCFMMCHEMRFCHDALFALKTRGIFSNSVRRHETIGKNGFIRTEYKANKDINPQHI